MCKIIMRLPLWQHVYANEFVMVGRGGGGGGGGGGGCEAKNELSEWLD